jgi:regulator of protease activity HflC (stomatin/prohibitin superfamily)
LMCYSRRRTVVRLLEYRGDNDIWRAMPHCVLSRNQNRILHFCMTRGKLIIDRHKNLCSIHWFASSSVRFDAASQLSDTLCQRSAMAQSPHWEGLRMRLLIELPLTIALFTLAVKAGWPYTVVFVLSYILAFNFKLTYLSRRTQVSTRFLVFIGVFLAFSMTASALIGRFFFLPNNQAWIETHRLWNFLLVTPALKMLWAAVMGFGLIALLAAVILIPYGQVAGQQMYSQYEQYKGHEGEAARAAINILLGISGGTWVVSTGQAELKGEQSGSLARFGGPGNLIVQEGHAVILEVSGKISRVVGMGITGLKTFERISMVVPLYTRAEKLVIEKVATKDKIIIEELELLVFHKADPGPEQERIKDGQFSYNEMNVRQNIWSPSGGDWRDGVCSVAETTTRDIVGRFNLEQIIPISDEFRINFRNLLTDQINVVTKPLMGVVVGTVEIGKIKVPEDAEKRLLEKWLTDWSTPVAETETEIEILKGEGEGSRDIGRAKARMEVTRINAQATVEKARADAEAVIIKGRAQAEARSDFYRRILGVIPTKDQAILLELVKRLQSEDELQAQAMSHLLLATDRQGYIGIAQRSLEVPSDLRETGLAQKEKPTHE